MIIFKRNISRRLLSLRISFIVLTVTCFFTFKSNFYNTGYLLSVVLIAMSIIVVKDFIVFSESFQITKYYFFGLIKREWKFEKTETVQIKSYGSDFGAEGDISDFDNTASEVGCLFSIFSVLIPPLIIKKEFKIEKLSDTNIVLKRVHILLDKYEFNLLQTFIH